MVSVKGHAAKLLCLLSCLVLYGWHVACWLHRFPCSQNQRFCGSHCRVNKEKKKTTTIKYITWSKDIKSRWFVNSSQGQKADTALASRQYFYQVQLKVVTLSDLTGRDNPVGRNIKAQVVRSSATGQTRQTKADSKMWLWTVCCKHPSQTRRRDKYLRFMAAFASKMTVVPYFCQYLWNVNYIYRSPVPAEHNNMYLITRCPSYSIATARDLDKLVICKQTE